jgi:outer membrane protein assembly factor BamB
MLGVAVALVLALAGAALVIRHVRAVKHPDEGVSTIVPTPSTAEQAGAGRAASPLLREKRVSITVRDRLSQRPVPRARITIAGVTHRADGHGVVVLQRPRRSRYRVIVQARGYSTLRDHVTFRHNRPFASVDLWKPAWSWPVYGATVERSNAQGGITLRPPLRTVWSLPLRKLLEFPPVTSNGVGYITDADGTLTAFRTQDGAWVWRRHLHEGMSASPALWRGRLYIASLAGQLRAFSADDGRLLWQRALGSSSETPPLIVDGLVVVGTWDGHVFAFNARTGRAAWRIRLHGKVTAGVARTRNALVVGDYSGTFYALAIRTGDVVWRTRVGGQLYSTPSVAHGRIFVTSSTRKTLVALSTRNGRQLWSRRLDGWAYPGAATADGLVVTGSYGGRLRAFRATDGKPRWNVPLGGRIYGSPQIVDGVVWASTFASRTDARDLRTGKLLQRFDRGRYVPVSGDAHTLLLLGFSHIWGLRPRH